MTNNYHTPPVDGAPANMSVIRAPLGELDAAITDQETRIGNLETAIPEPSGNPTEYYDGNGGWTVPAGTGVSVDGHLIKDEGVSLPQRASIDFVGAGVTVTNEAGGTQVNIPGASSAPATTAENDFQVGDGFGGWIKKTLAEVVTILQDSLNSVYAAISHSHAAGEVTSGTLATERLGSGAADNTKYLRGDQVWATIDMGDKYPMEARLTLETGVAVSVSNQLAKTDLYLTKYNGNQVAVYVSGAWVNLTLSSDISISLSGLGRSQAYTNDPAAGSNIVLNMVNTTGFLVGDIVKVSSSAGSEEATITVVTANTSITLDALTLNHTTTSPLVTGKLPYDVYVFSNSGTLALELVAWTNRTTRATALATQDGVNIKNGDATRRYIGVISTTTTIGQCEFMVSGGTTVSQKILIQNFYNKVPVLIYVAETTATWAWTTAAWRQLRGIKYNQFDFIDGDGLMPVELSITYEGYTTSGACDAYAALGLDQLAVVNSGTVAHLSAAVNTTSVGYAFYNSVVPVGGHYLALLEYGRAALVVVGKTGQAKTGASGTFYC